MILEELKKNDLLQMLSFINTEMEQMYFVVDKTFKVQYSNQAFHLFFKKDDSEITDHDFGDVLGCGNMFKDGKFCAFTSYCKTCEIRQNLHHIFNKTKDRVVFDLVREYLIMEETIIRHLQFKIMPISLNGENFAICLVEDLKDKDALKILNDPEALA
ncbi:MAG: hypothetical protein GQ527_12400 [Bacteroidales bacterium]|nr:hypothetical protein [Bacteroidales bacterium]